MQPSHEGKGFGIEQAQTHVLAVDDDGDVRSVLRRGLLREGFAVAEVADEEERSGTVVELGIGVP